jgi:hypothetical protein
MKNASQYRALALLCRQQAAHDPLQNWELLAEAEYYEHLADKAPSHLIERTTNRPVYCTKSEAA